MNKGDCHMESWLPLAEKVVKNHQFLFVDSKNEVIEGHKGCADIILDATTAGMLVTITKKLSEKHLNDFVHLPLNKAVNLAWKLIAHSKGY